MAEDATMADAPANDDIATKMRILYPKRGLPPSLSSTYPHGLISGSHRSPRDQEAFDYRKASILQTMNKTQIEEAYWETVGKINALLEDDRKKNEEVEREMKKLVDQRELERKLFYRQREEKAGKSVKGEGHIKMEMEIDT
ncbi:hypothetical protein MMC10_003840 [Thelotrema lepadinum]|nr:hypothetical protein [Thelotrema lepadinum]